MLENCGRRLQRTVFLECKREARGSVKQTCRPSLVFLWVCPGKRTEALQRPPKQARTIFCERLQRLLLSICDNSQQRESENALVHGLAEDLSRHLHEARSRKNRSSPQLVHPPLQGKPLFLRSPAPLDT